MPSPRKPLSSKKLLKETPDGKEIKRLLNEMQDLGDRSMVIVGGAVFAESFRRFIESRMRNDLHPEDKNRMFDASQGGYISSLDAQLRLAFALGWIEADFFEDALIIQGIRNVFAHSFHDISFLKNEIKADCQKLKMKFPLDSDFATGEKTIESLWFRNWLFIWTYLISARAGFPPPLPTPETALPVALTPENGLEVINKIFSLGGDFIRNSYGAPRSK